MEGQTDAWRLYNELVEGIPEDVQVIDYALGLNWSYLQAECGAGVAYTLGEGAKGAGAGDLRGRPLREAAALAKSWCFKEATLGVAALNAWYGQRRLLEAMGAAFEAPCDLDGCRACEGDARRPCERPVDAFDAYRPEVEAFAGREGRRARVVVVGHFPHVEDIAEYADLTVLERRCRNDVDTPDPACEYVLPGADYAFLTGATLINKTMPRLLELARAASVAVVGPSAVASAPLFARGVDAVAGRCVADPERARFSVVSGEPFADALESFIVRR